MTDSKRLESSPEAYFRKKFAGRFMTRIIMAASTDSEVFSEIRFIISSRTVVMSCVAIMEHSRKEAVPARNMTLPLSSTVPVSTPARRGLNMPKRVISSVRPMSSR